MGCCLGTQPWREQPTLERAPHGKNPTRAASSGEDRVGKPGKGTSSLKLEKIRAFLGGELDKQATNGQAVKETLGFTVRSVRPHPPSKRHGLAVQLSVYDEHGALRYVPLGSEMVRASPQGVAEFNLVVNLCDVVDSDIIKLRVVRAFFGDTSRRTLGYTVISVGDLRSRSCWPDLWLFRHSVPVFDGPLETPVTVEITDIMSTEVDKQPSAGPTTLRGLPKGSRRFLSEEIQTASSIEGGLEKLGLSSHVLLEDDDEDDEDEEDGSSASGFGPLEESTGSSAVEESDVSVTPASTPGPSDELAEESAARIESALGETQTTEPPVSKAVTEGTASTESAATAEHEEQVPSDTPSDRPKHLLVLTRGTRGDVQPFIALAKGLADLKGWTVTICTELRYRSLVRRHRSASRGRIQFRPSGGDTEARISTPIARWAVSTKIRLVHAAILARTEREFFDSEPAFHYWARILRPDVLCYTFTTANIAMIASESLGIPAVGFFLQPTVLPSKQYPAIVPLRLENLNTEKNQLEVDGLESHKAFHLIKGWWENNIFSRRLEEMRKMRGLPKGLCHENDFEKIVNLGMEVVVPIKPGAFGGKPPDWPASVQMTDFIFLRGTAVPQLDDSLASFVSNAKAADRQLVAICFSSMPVSRAKIAEASLLMLDRCPEPYMPCIIALVGNHGEGEVLSASLQARLDKYEAQGRLFITKGAPFSRLFPLMDFIVLHGGLGTTGECLAAGVPCMVTGVLLLDQRFWGRRVHELGVGPPPAHISDFTSVILDVLPKALNPKGEWRRRATEVAAELFPEGLENMSDGVAENVEAFVACAARARVRVAPAMASSSSSAAHADQPAVS